MQPRDGAIGLSPTDLANHLACRHLTVLDLAVAEGRLAPPDANPGFTPTLQQRGEAHERAYVEHLRSQGLAIADLWTSRTDAHGLGHTLAIMRQGTDVIVQAPLLDGRWAGRADVLRRVATPSALGAWSYEPLDTKLARETRGSAILQLCAYSQILESLQGVRPASIHVVSPGSPFNEHSYRLDDYYAYYAFVRRRLEAFVDGEEPAETYPDPTAHCDVCRWYVDCDRHRRGDDHLSLVANIRKLHIAELQRWNVTTLAGLGRLPVPFPHKPKRGSADALLKAREQARVQLEARDERRLVFELLPRVAPHGFFRLPPPSDGDLFFDIEGDPFAGDSGREYLFGYVMRDPAGSWMYECAWAMDAAHEKHAFEAFVALVMQRWARYPDLHIYHYAPYEPSAIRKLMGRHAVCEDAVDRMLRGGLFIDLHAITRQALRAGVERYSIKNLEPFFGFERSLPLREASAHLRAIELQLELGDTEISDDSSAAVEAYNRDDCLAALGLRDWLESLRTECERGGEAIPRPPPKSAEPTEALDARRAAVRVVMDQLLDGIPADAAQRSPSQQGHWILAQLLEFHRREDKSVWWEFHRLADVSEEDARDEPGVLVGLEFLERVGGTKKCPVDRYAFPAQEVLIRLESEAYATRELEIGTVEALDLDARTIDIKKRSAAADVHPTLLFFHDRVNPEPLPSALLRLATWVASHGLEADGPYRAVRRLLLKEPPRLTADACWESEGESLEHRAARLALSLDHTVLPVQGPPGSGKTHIGAEMICALVRAGKKVGVTGTSHKVIRNLLSKVQEIANHRDVSVTCAQKVREISEHAVPGIKETDSNADVLDAIVTGEAQVAAGTPWLWARSEFVESVDVLIVDEAGQMSLANVLAAGQAATSLVLLGDPSQLEQPLQGSHPDGTAVSVLQHVLGSDLTLPPDRGLFLELTWRLHPIVAAFTSGLFYEGRLHSRPGLEVLELHGPEWLRGAGLWFLPVDHSGNQNTSPEEVEVVARLASLLGDGGFHWTGSDSTVSPLTSEDILIVAPYNAHVQAISERLPNARVGTVDRFQGQQSAAVIYSMATSTPEEAPRGMEFLYNLNRLNVATSRAKCAVVLVASPRLFEPDCQTPRQMQLANAFCRYLEVAKLLSADCLGSRLRAQDSGTEVLP